MLRFAIPLCPLPRFDGRSCVSVWSRLPDLLVLPSVTPSPSMILSFDAVTASRFAPPPPSLLHPPPSSISESSCTHGLVLTRVCFMTCLVCCSVCPSVGTCMHSFRVFVVSVSVPSNLPLLQSSSCTTFYIPNEYFPCKLRDHPRKIRGGGEDWNPV